MDSLISLYAAYVQRTNIYDEVKNFQKQEHHSPNFCKVMDWLQDSLEMQQCSHIDEVVTTLTMQSPGGRLVLEATITENDCIMTKMKYQDA